MLLIRSITIIISTILFLKKLRHSEIPRYPRDEIATLPRHPIVCLLDNVRSAENVGSIFRSADAFGIERIALEGITPTPTIKNLHRSALGSQDVVDWVQLDNALEFVSSLKGKGYSIAALEICDISREPSELFIDEYPLCLIVGNEINGVSQNLLERCDFAIEIPQYGFKQSLNVAVATGIALHATVMRYREIDGPVQVPDPRSTR